MTLAARSPHFNPDDPLELMDIRLKLFRETAALCKKLPANQQPDAVRYILLGRRLGLAWPPVAVFQRALDDTRQALAEAA